MPPSFSLAPAGLSLNMFHYCSTKKRSLPLLFLTTWLAVLSKTAPPCMQAPRRLLLAPVVFCRNWFRKTSKSASQVRVFHLPGIPPSFFFVISEILPWAGSSFSSPCPPTLPLKVFDLSIFFYSLHPSRTLEFSVSFDRCGEMAHPTDHRPVREFKVTIVVFSTESAPFL